MIGVPGPMGQMIPMPLNALANAQPPPQMNAAQAAMLGLSPLQVALAGVAPYHQIPPPVLAAQSPPPRRRYAVAAPAPVFAVAPPAAFVPNVFNRQPAFAVAPAPAPAPAPPVFVPNVFNRQPPKPVIHSSASGMITISGHTTAGPQTVYLTPGHQAISVHWSNRLATWKVTVVVTQMPGAYPGHFVRYADATSGQFQVRVKTFTRSVQYDIYMTCE